MARRQFALAVHTLVLLAKSPDASTSAALASGMNTHATCLRRMLGALAQAGLVESLEGRDGGYRLALSPAEITLADVYAALVGDPLLRPNSSLANADCPISAAMKPLFAEIAADAEAGVQQALSRRTLADLTRQVDSLAHWIH